VTLSKKLLVTQSYVYYDISRISNISSLSTG